MKQYEAPTLSELGSVIDVTRGADDSITGDGSSRRGPAEDPITTS
jgi:hypothetical protein